MKTYKHKKKYGQNFLDSSELLEKIKEVINADKQTECVEIGPGHAFLTSMLIQNFKFVTAYEIDKELIPYLNEKLKKYDNYKIINEDFMQSNIEGDNIKVVANIPYYITSPIIEKLIENRDKIDEIFLMVQKEVGERICSIENKKNVSILTHAVNFYAETEYLFTVNKEYFNPIPKVDSAFIKIKIRKDKKYENQIDDKIYFKFLKQAFSNKRKTLYNNLNPIITKEELKKIFGRENVRAEELSIEEIIKLIKEIKYE